jgi:hypothetical protein
MQQPGDVWVLTDSGKDQWCGSFLPAAIGLVLAVQAIGDSQKLNTLH